MTQEEKEILLKDLCARLPYNVKCLYRNVDDENKIGKLNIIQYDEERIVIDTTSLDHKGSDVVGVFPYLFPLSSMTEEQKKELDKLGWYFDNFGIDNIDEYHDDKEVVTHILCSELVDWLNKNHFDYRGLISKGLAIDATGLNIY